MPAVASERLHRSVAEWFLRIALAASFLSAVADRFGLWGKPGSPGVAWGDWAHFRGYADLLNAWMPAALRAPAAIGATAAEIALGVGLLVPWRRPWIALASGALLSAFAIAMTVAMSPKAPLDYSVWSAAGGSFVLASLLARS